MMRTGLLLALGITSPSVFAQAFHNGSFTAGKYEKGEGFVELQSGSRAIEGWVVTGSVDWVDSDWKGSDGKRSIDLSGSVAGSVSQTFSTKVGHKYRIKFDFAGNPLGAPDLKRMNVVVDGNAARTYTFSIKGHYNSNMGWVHRSYDFVAKKSASKLTFTSLTNTQFGPVICRVSESEVLPPRPRKHK
jgi:choice-of-anchor C domain-containing protein